MALVGLRSEALSLVDGGRTVLSSCRDFLLRILLIEMVDLYAVSLKDFL